MPTLRAVLSRLAGQYDKSPRTAAAESDEQPLRAELFSADQMELHGKTLAESHTLQTEREKDQLLQRLDDNERRLNNTCQLLMACAKTNARITPAGEWLLDNFYLIEQQILTAKTHLPKGYSRELPILADGPSKGQPRVYDLALEVISHGDGRVDPENLDRFVTAYQRVSVLTLGELWAIPIMLRLALIENLRRVSTRVTNAMIERNRAGVWADEMLEIAERDPKSLILVTSDMARSNPPMVNSFVAELVRRLHGQSAALALPLTWIEHRLSESGLTIEQMVQSETQSQAANQVCISNSIGSLRFLGATDWRVFVESKSAVENTLNQDPEGVYAQMDFTTRDRYRHVVESLARRCALSEVDVAREAINLARKALPLRDYKVEDPRGHVGYYLIDKGLTQLEQSIAAQRSAVQALRAGARQYSLSLYLGAIAVLTALMTLWLMQLAVAPNLPIWQLAFMAVFAVVGTSQLAVSLVNWAATLLATPYALPRMDFSKGIAPQARTLVVVPTLLTSLKAVDSLTEALEVRYLANQDPCLHFALLTDYLDATQETTPDDAPLLHRATERMAALNAKYPRPVGDTFFLLHRPRRWNPQERIWMGFERKRGKLAALNALLRGASEQDFSHTVGDTSALRQVQFVITLDTDTQLQRDSARVFAATLAHPLNRPRYDETLQRVTEGYGILQPSMAVSLPSTNRSRYARLCGSEAGVDPYTRAVSDVYQDLFQQGSFIGKGIYDVDAFERALKGRFPENRILSHDLLEGCYARAGLISDVQLYDDYPARYDADVSRRHRWIRGDWQIASWLLPRVPGTGRQPQCNPLSALSQWKIFDNLRRSLVPMSMVALLALGWLHGADWADWTLSVLGLLYLTPILNTMLGFLRKPKNLPVGQHLMAALQLGFKQMAQTTFHLACLPYEAIFSLDAIIRTTTRVAFTHRNMLEWKASGDGARSHESANAQADAPGGLGDLWKTVATMWMGSALAVLIAAVVLTLHPQALWIATPVLLLWLAAPALAWWLSRPLVDTTVRLQPTETVFLFKLARRTWHFFETFVTAEHHWLPPDNYQEHPASVVAHRTSPTNMGMALLANLSAYDFGYISVASLLARTSATLQTMQGLDRHCGHFFNWYDTRTLRPLPPRYVSSVDSGNLTGHLLTLRPGLLALADQKIFGARTFEGLGDAIGNLQDALPPDASAELADAVSQVQRAFDSTCSAHPVTTTAVRRGLNDIAAPCLHLISLYKPGPVRTDGTDSIEWRTWAQAVLVQCQDALADLDYLVPWDEYDTPALPGWLKALPAFGEMPSLRELATLDAALERAFARQSGPSSADQSLVSWLRPLVTLTSTRAGERMQAIQRLAQQAADLAQADYHFLYDNARHLFTVGYNVDEHRRDTGHYDLLASEARLCSFVAIAQGQVPQENWFALGRLLTSAGGDPILLSWSGSMFEYLMPLLVMPSCANTLLAQTCLAAVKHQITYGHQRGVPWGISESGYNAVDTALNYQYRAFGVPGQGLKRGLAEDLVIAPYASALALMVAPVAACKNLQRMVVDGFKGRYGMYEAIDFTPSRLPRGQTSAVVRSFMAHHQGMSLLAMAYVLLDQPMQKRFESDPLFQATTLLLQERIPKAAMFHVRSPDLSDMRTTTTGPEMPMRILRDVDTAVPEVQLLSNGRYHVMVSQAGGGYSRWKDIAVTRWREDGTRDNWGAFCYLRDVTSGEFWSCAHQPTLKKADTYEAIFSEGRAEFRRQDHGYETHTEIVVSPEDDIELRRLHITNRSRARRTIEVTSYAEVVLAPAVADAVHPAFSNLFVQTEIVQELQAVLCNRRPRSDGEHQPWMFHLMAVHGGDCGTASFETDRMRFIGRTLATDAPQAMLVPGPLSCSAGAVLDPMVAIRHFITLEPQQTVTIDVVYGISDTRELAMGLIGKYRDRHLADRVFDLAWTHSWVNLQQINASESDAQLYGRLASSVIYANRALRADTEVLKRNRRGQSGLWGYGISGDLPIVLLQIGKQDNIDLVRQLVQAHSYWRLKGLIVDLVIWNEDHAGYRQLLQEQIMGLIASGAEANFTDRPGGIFVRIGEQVSTEDRTLFQAVARVIITDNRGTLTDQVNRSVGNKARELPIALQNQNRTRKPDSAAIGVVAPHDLIFFNGIGGFAPDGREYAITTTRGQTTPAPWVNVIANARFGTVISESGSAYTWSENAHEFRYTPWSNDPVSDGGGEAFYLRDEETGAFWSPTPLPCGGQAPYTTRHGFGYSVFEHTEDGIHSELTIYVHLDAAIKFSRLKIRNQSGRPRRLSATGYVEWVLGDLQSKSAMHVSTEIEPISGAILARNPYSTEFSDRVAFFDADAATQMPFVTVCADRRQFLGRNGTLANPAAMAQVRLSNKVGAGLDPCAAVQVPFELADGQTRELTFRLGAAGRRGIDDARAVVHSLREPDAAQRVLPAVHAYWKETLGAVQVNTPDPALNVLANGWLLYQTIACRLWARSGYYQSGGAFGFRDQLQDVMALVHTAPHMLREHLLQCASRQFIEGDVQHWWHPPQGRGVRTHCSDDFLWLPQAACRYVQATSDHGVLNESVAFLEGRPVPPGEDSYYDLPGQSTTTATLYEHCVRAIVRGLSKGVHGLPLMGTGDWNDGMNLVGIKGQGESVWLAFFLFDTLVRFSPLARAHGDSAFAEECLAQAEQLRQAIDQHGWDGGWYRRAYFDDGTPLGSSTNEECQIDSISQSWSVLSGAGDPVRSRTAMNALDQRLVRRDNALIQLLDPPFNTSNMNPGYIKGYVPGVRENGGQYTHAAIWTTMAFAASGDAVRAWECFHLINPVHHGDSAKAIATYKAEPYVVAADVYGVAPHTGRGGWTWYTGSASWMYRLILESLLGLYIEAGQLRFKPCMPIAWSGFSVHYRYRRTQFTIAVTQAHGPIEALQVTVNGVLQPTAAVNLVDDQATHRVELNVTSIAKV